MISRRVLVLAGVVLLSGTGSVLAALGASTTPRTETVVEGHNVFTVIQAAQSQNLTGVTILVREFVVTQGKLWFNDQYLISPYFVGNNFTYNPANLQDCRFRDDNSFACVRYPCGGAVLVQGTGQFTETKLLHPGQNPPTPQNGYIESYWITDPNDNVFIIDKYKTETVTVSQSVWQSLPNWRTYTRTWSYRWWVNLRGTPTFTPDDGVSNCPPFIDNPTAGYYEPTDPSVNGGASYCYDGNPALAGETPGGGCAYDAYASSITFSIPGGKTTLHNYRRYNAEVVFFIDEVPGPRGSVLHGTTNSDTNGCESNPFGSSWAAGGPRTEWFCPANDDNREGNSHPFNPTDGGANTPSHRHDTVQVQITYQGQTRSDPVPPTRTYRIFDTEGAAAPFDFRH